MCLFGARGVEKNKVDWVMVVIDLGQFREVGMAVSWRGQRCRIMIPINTPSEKVKNLIFRARLDAFIFGANHVPQDMVHRELGVAGYMDFFAGRVFADKKIIELPKNRASRKLEMD